MNWFTRLLRRVVAWFRPDAAAVGVSTKGRANCREDKPPTPATPDPPPAPPPPRRERRRLSALERARHKQDKFVTPQGPQPVKQTRAHHHWAIPVQIKDEPDEDPIADKINDVDEDVLIKRSEVYGVYNFRDSILDQLERYWFYIERMRKHAPDTYELYKKIGATLVPPVALLLHERSGPDFTPFTAQEIEGLKKNIALPPWFNQKRPAFGCVGYATHPLNEKWEKEDKYFSPRFIYFTKFTKPPPEFQPMSGGDVYKMTIWFDFAYEKKKKWGMPVDVGIWVSRDGREIHVLRMIDTKMVRVQQKHSLKTFRIPQRAWHVPEVYEEWAKKWALPVDLYFAKIFCDAVASQIGSEGAMIRVAVHKGDLTAAFGVEIKRTPYFFQDRDIELTEHGQKKRIFHIVRPHVRADGAAVHMHFRGQKNFTWAGYRVEITVPGRDHFMLSELDIGSHDSYWHEKDKDYLSSKEMADYIDKAMHEGKGGRR